MKDFLLIAGTKDLDLSSLDIQLTSDTGTYVIQKLRTVILAVKNSYFTNKNLGLPWFDDVLKKNPNTQLISDLFKEAIIGVAEVQEINAFQLAIDNTIRMLQVTFSVTLLSGEQLNNIVI